MIRRVIIGAAVIAAALATCRPAHAEPSTDHTCIVFEDDSFICGTLLVDEGRNSGGWALDRSRPWIEGCIPDGRCDREANDLDGVPMVQLHDPE